MGWTIQSGSAIDTTVNTVMPNTINDPGFVAPPAPGPAQAYTDPTTWTDQSAVGLNDTPAAQVAIQ